MLISVTRISIPAMSTIGYGWGKDETGRVVRFVGDHRPMRDIGEAMQHMTSDEPITVDLEDWQVTLPGDPA
jgi:hypothetical protein